MKKFGCFAILILVATVLSVSPQASSGLAQAAVPQPAAAHSVSLAWVASTDSVTGYNVYRGTSSGSYAGAPLNGGIPVGSLSYTDASVSPGTYFYVVRAVILAGTTQTESANSNETKAVILPSAPTALQTTTAN